MSTERTPLTDEVLRRIGRNLIIYQQIESFLKLLLGHFRIAGPTTQLAKLHKEQAVRIDSKTLGSLVGEYSADVLSDAGEEPLAHGVPDDWFVASLHINGTEYGIESLRRDLKAMTDARNELVHHFLPRWQAKSEEQLTETLAYLDAQRESVLPLHEHLSSNLQSAYKTYEVLLEKLSKEQIQPEQPQVLSLQDRPLVKFLYEFAGKYARLDGWTYLSQAGSLAVRDLPEEVQNISQNYGFKTLKKLIVGAGIFETLDEPLANGKYRTLYRRKAST